MILFIGLNPSTANENTNDRTIKRVMAIANHNGYGGVYMMNLFLFVSTDPDQLKTIGDFLMNDYWLLRNSKQCKDVLFAWGNFDVIKETGRDKKIIAMFPNAKAIVLNKSGSPKHPLYCKKESLIINFKNHE